MRVQRLGATRFSACRMASRSIRAVGARPASYRGSSGRKVGNQLLDLLEVKRRPRRCPMAQLRASRGLQDEDGFRGIEGVQGRKQRVGPIANQPAVSSDGVQEDA